MPRSNVTLSCSGVWIIKCFLSLIKGLKQGVLGIISSLLTLSFVQVSVWDICLVAQPATESKTTMRTKKCWISISNSMICSDIWHKYHEWYFEIVIRNFTSRRRVKFETILKYHEWYIYARYHVQIMLLFVYTTAKGL